jgi:hypothetical protein
MCTHAFISLIRTRTVDIACVVVSFKQNMAGDSTKWKAITLKQKLNSVQKVEENLNNGEIFR